MPTDIKPGVPPTRLTVEEINSLPDNVAEELLRLYMVEGFADELVNLIGEDEDINNPIKDPEAYALIFNLTDGIRGFPLFRDYETTPGEKLKTLKELKCLQDNSHIPSPSPAPTST